jgi:hypothetical protein
MKEILRRRQEQSAAVKSRIAQNKEQIFAKKGISSGIKTKNKHLAEFEKVKAGHKKRQGLRLTNFHLSEATITVDSFNADDCTCFVVDMGFGMQGSQASTTGKLPPINKRVPATKTIGKTL